MEVDFSNTDTIMVYGDTDVDLPMALLDDLNQAGVIIVFHRRNKLPIWIWPSPAMDRHDVLSQQIRCRDNQTRAVYVARTLIKARFTRMRWLIELGGSPKALDGARSISLIRQIEAHRTARFWDLYFERLDLTDAARRGNGPVQAALDACSVFMSGILLRWTLFHRLAPTHGFLHEPTGYPALVYDLLEPYRDGMEQAVFKAASEEGVEDEKRLVAASIQWLKHWLQEEVWVPTFQKSVRRKNLLHGIVLALRSYVVGESPRFVIPIEGPKNGGRPVKAAFALPGARRPLK